MNHPLLIPHHNSKTVCSYQNGYFASSSFNDGYFSYHTSVTTGEPVSQSSLEGKQAVLQYQEISYTHIIRISACSAYWLRPGSLPQSSNRYIITGYNKLTTQI